MLIYRDEIDGLRALAVLSVIFYHIGGISWFLGGYVGVDMFFVISGYLITSIIDADLEETRFSLLHFYERRCRRILPPLYAISFISCYFAYQWMSPGQLKEFGYSLISIATFSSNIFFWWKDDQYFSRLSELNPMVHTWSLAVEEQFYLVFPLLFYLISKHRRYLIIFLGFLTLLSFYLAQWGGNIRSTSITVFYMFMQHPLASFYMPIGRVWELLIGAFVSFYLKTNNSVTSRKAPYVYAQLLALLGLLLIIISVVLLDNRIIPPFPNCYTLIPTFGTALIIIFGNQHTIVGRLLSVRALRYVGIISYSAYLWHQPILVYLRLRSIEMQNILHVSVVIVAILLLATLTYVFIEQPFRNRTLFSQKYIFSFSGIGTLFVLLVALFLIRTADYRNLIVSKVIQNQSLVINKTINNQSSAINEAIYNRNLTLEETLDTYLHDIEPIELSNYVTRRFDNHMKKYSTFSNESAMTNRRILLVGDSFAQDFMNMIAETQSVVNYEIRCYYIRVYCQIYMGPEDRLQWISPGHRQICVNTYDIRDALPLIRQANIIILAGCWLEWSAKRLPRTIQLLNLTQSQKLFVLGVKNFGKIDLKLYINKSFEYRTKQFQQPEEDFVNINRIMKQSFNETIFIDVLNMTCTYYNSTCPVFTPQGKLISYDGWHTMKHGARYVGNIIFKSFPLNQL